MLTQPRQRINVVTTASLLLAGMLAAPVLAAPDRGLLCEADTDLKSDLTATELSVTPASNNDELLQGHLLKPRAEAAARGAFAQDAVADEDVVEGEEPAAEEAVVAEPGIPSASERKRPIYERQMYRRDI